MPGSGARHPCRPPPGPSPAAPPRSPIPTSTPSSSIRWPSSPSTWCAGARDGLERLGRTRAAVLPEAADGARTTSEAAEAAGLALPSASYRIGVLRDGGLVVSRCDGKYVRHTVTPLGLCLLDSTGTRPGTGAVAGAWHDRNHA